MAKQKNITPLKLSEPFEYAGEPYDVLNLRRPTANDISELGTDIKIGDLIKIGLKCAGLPPTAKTMELLSAKDGAALSNMVSDFL